MPTTKHIDTLTVSGSGFGPGETVTATFELAGGFPMTAQADDQGRVSFAVPVTAEFRIGAHTVTLTGETSGVASAEFNVLDTSDGNGGDTGNTTPESETPDEDVLANTGVEPGIFAGAAVLVLGAVGAGLVIRSRRRT